MDITDRRRAEEALQQRIFEVAHFHEQIRELGIRDGLTGLFKGRYLEGQLACLFADHDSHSTLAVAMLDIDHLKEINDKYSRQIGDVALQTFADSYKNYQQVIRAADDLMSAAKRRGRNRVMIERSG